jgi:hypothetical protein
MVELTDLMESLKAVQNPSALGQNLVAGLFTTQPDNHDDGPD